MLLSLYLYLSVTLALRTSSANRVAASTDNHSAYATSHPIADTKDAFILGGGASGTYAAARLKDMGKSFVLVEARDTLGGHTESWTDPQTGNIVELGVEIWHNTSATRYIVNRFGIPVQRGPAPNNRISSYVDSLTGKVIEEGIGYNMSEVGAALGRYAQQRAKYVDLSKGYFLPYPIPEDLTLPFIEFARKYDLEAILYFFYIQKQGGDDFLQERTLYILKEFSLDRVAQDVEDLTMTTNNTHALYDAALKELGNDVFLSSRIWGVDRSLDDYNLITISTPSGLQIIRAKTLLITIPPIIDKLSGLDLSAEEIRLFSKMTPHHYYTGLVNSTGFPDNAWYLIASSDAEYCIPGQPSTYAVRSSPVTGIFDWKYGHGKINIDPESVKLRVLATIRAMCISGGLNTTGSCDPQIIAYASHSPYDLMVSADDIKNGFYEQLYGLQGQLNTFYSGAAFGGHDSGELWDFTEALLSKIVAALDSASSS